MNTQIVTQRESDGKFALQMATAAAFERDNKRIAARRQREAQLIADNAEWCKSMGFDPRLAAEIFA